LMDCEDSPEASAALFKSLASEGFIDLVNGDSGTALSEQAKVAFHQTRKVHAITNHIVRCAVYPDPRNRGAIEDAKVFVQKWDEDCGISAISKMWEKYRLAAPFIYAFHLEERSFRPLDAVSSANVINWARTVVARQGRIQRILGHGAFAVDVLARTAKGQRQADFFGIKRIIPPVRPFSSQERLIMDSIDRAAPLR